MPNAGKSTFIRAVSNARPKVADYPFTTLHPNLGVVRVGPEQSFVIAISGTDRGCRRGCGLGHQFLRHLSRTGLLLHLVDCRPVDDSDPCATSGDRCRAAQVRRAALQEARWLVLNKIDLVPVDERDAMVTEFRRRLRTKGRVFAISAATGEGAANSPRKSRDSCRPSGEPRRLRFRQRRGRPRRRNSHDFGGRVCATCRREGRQQPGHERRPRPRLEAISRWAPRWPGCGNSASRCSWSRAERSPKACSGSGGPASAADP